MRNPLGPPRFRIIRIAPIFLGLLLGAAGCATVAPPASPPPAHITILHWNDFHAHDAPYTVVEKNSTGERRYLAGGSATLDAYLRHFGRHTDGVVAVNAGDDFQGTPASTLTNGGSQITLMNLLGPDVVTLGNHEFDYGLASLREKLRGARYPILTANLFDSTTGTTFRPATLLRRVGSVNVGFVGFLPPDLDILTMRGNLAGLRILDVDSVLSVCIPALRHAGADLIVVISHMGVEVDTSLAARRQDIDVIVGGHSHTPLFTPIRKGRTVIVQAGSWGRYLGKLDLTVDLQRDSVLTGDGQLIETIPGTYPEDSTVVRTVASIEAQVGKKLDSVVAVLSTPWKASLFEESNVGDWICDALRAFSGAEVVFVNSGGIRRDIPTGPVRLRDLWELSPFNNTLLKFRIDGRTLSRILAWQATGKPEFMQVSGVRYTAQRDLPTPLTEATVSGQPIDSSRTYTILTNNYVAGHAGPLLGVENLGPAEDLMRSDRDVITEALRRAGTVDAGKDGRITIIHSSPASPRH